MIKYEYNGFGEPNIIWLIQKTGFGQLLRSNSIMKEDFRNHDLETMWKKPLVRHKQQWKDNHKESNNTISEKL